jgi:hypothetical protein
MVAGAVLAALLRYFPVGGIMVVAAMLVWKIFVL